MLTIEVIKSATGICLAINDRRIAGPEPSLRQQTIATWAVSPDTIVSAIREATSVFK